MPTIHTTAASNTVTMITTVLDASFPSPLLSGVSAGTVVSTPAKFSVGLAAGKMGEKVDAREGGSTGSGVVAVGPGAGTTWVGL